MKRKFALLLSALLSVSSVLPVMAAETAEGDTEEPVIVFEQRFDASAPRETGDPGTGKLSAGDINVGTVYSASIKSEDKHWYRFNSSNQERYYSFDFEVDGTDRSSIRVQDDRGNIVFSKDIYDMEPQTLNFDTKKETEYYLIIERPSWADDVNYSFMIREFADGADTMVDAKKIPENVVYKDSILNSEHKDWFKCETGDKAYEISFVLDHLSGDKPSVTLRDKDGKIVGDRLYCGQSLNAVWDRYTTYYLCVEGDYPGEYQFKYSSRMLNAEWLTKNESTGIKSYWYEGGIRQGTTKDPKGVIGDGTNRGREIYDPNTDGWYWLDSCYDGAKACNKEVWVPYIYQNERNCKDPEIEANANNSGSMRDQVIDCIKNKKGKWVRYDANGKMYKGWYTVEGADAEIYPNQVGNRYYYDPQTGLMAKGRQIIGGQEYYFNEETGALQQ